MPKHLKHLMLELCDTSLRGEVCAHKLRLVGVPPEKLSLDTVVTESGPASLAASGAFYTSFSV